MAASHPPALEPLVGVRNQLGECPLWCDQRRVLYWTDIDAARMYRWTERDGSLRHWDLPHRVGSLALCSNPDLLLLAMAPGVALFDTLSGQIGELVPVEADQPTTRLNDGRVDRQGRFIFGTLNEAPDGAPIGQWYRIGPNLRPERLPLPSVTVANGLAFSPDGLWMYFSDSPARVIWRARYPATGMPHDPVVFVRVPSSSGYPDGAATDAAGGLWVAMWDGARLVRFDAGGMESFAIGLPVARPTCPVFGGTGLSRLYVTSARTGLEPERLADEPLSGALLTLSPGWCGVPEARFQTDLQP